MDSLDARCVERTLPLERNGESCAWRAVPCRIARRQAPDSARLFIPER